MHESWQKKPTTANRQRLEAAIHLVKKLMPRVYSDSTVNQTELNIPLHEEREMHDVIEEVVCSSRVAMFGLAILPLFLLGSNISCRVYVCI